MNKAKYIAITNLSGDEIFINTDSIVFVKKNKDEKCELVLACERLQPGKNTGDFPSICRKEVLNMSFEDMRTVIANLDGPCNEFFLVQGTDVILNRMYSYLLDSDRNLATPIAMRLPFPGTEIYGEFDLSEMPFSENPRYCSLKVGNTNYWININSIVAFCHDSSNGYVNYWHACLIGGEIIRIRGSWKTIYLSNEFLHTLPLVAITQYCVVNLQHTLSFNSRKSVLTLSEKVGFGDIKNNIFTVSYGKDKIIAFYKNNVISKMDFLRAKKVKVVEAELNNNR